MATDKMVTISPNELLINCETIKLNDKAFFRSLGFPDTPSSYIFEFIERIKKEAFSICRPHFGYQILKGEVLTKSDIEIGGVFFHSDYIITDALKESDYFLILIASVGDELTKWLEKKKNDNDIMEMFISDILASNIVEAISATGLDLIEAELKRKGFFMSHSYSPGYCGWNVIEQQKIFKLFPTGFCGVTLTDSSLMLPIKSISAVVGVGRDVVKKPYGCAICRKKDCYKRK